MRCKSLIYAVCGSYALLRDAYKKMMQEEFPFASFRLSVAIIDWLCFIAVENVNLVAIYKVLPYDIGCWGDRGYRVQEVERHPHRQYSIFLPYGLSSRNLISIDISEFST